MIKKEEIIEVLVNFGGSPIESDHCLDSKEMFEQYISGLLENFKQELNISVRPSNHA